MIAAAEETSTDDESIEAEISVEEPTQAAGQPTFDSTLKPKPAKWCSPRMVHFCKIFLTVMIPVGLLFFLGEVHRRSSRRPPEPTSEPDPSQPMSLSAVEDEMLSG